MKPLKRFLVTTPEGEDMPVLLPEDATDQQIIDEAKRIRAKNTPVINRKNGPIDTRSPLQRQMDADPTTGMSGGQLALAGAGKAVADVGQGLSQLFGGASQKDVQATRERDRPLMDRPTAMQGNLAAGLGLAMLPGGVMRAAVPSIRTLGGSAAARLAQAGSNELLSPTTISGGAIQGGVYGGMQPVGSDDERGRNIILGAGAGGAFPALTRGAKMGNAAIEPFSDKGQANIISRLLARVSGDEAPQVRQRIKDASAPAVGPFLPGEEKEMMGQRVPGSFPSVAEIAQNPGIASLQRTATAIDPVVQNRMFAQRGANDEARVSQLQKIAGADGQIDFYKADRDQVANMLYEEARRKGYDPADVPEELIAEMQQLMQRPSIKIGMARAKRKAAEQNIKLDADSSVMGLDYVRRSLSDQIEAAKRAGNKDDARLFTQTMEKLDGVLQQLSPEYAQAVGTYASMSKPINTMEAADALLKASQNPMTGSLYPLKYHKNLSDEFVQGALGRRGATLEGTFPMRDRAMLDSIGEDLKNQSFADTAGRGVGSDTVQKLAFANLVDSAGMPTFLRSLPVLGRAGRGVGQVAEKGAQALYGRANREMSETLANAMADPRQLDALLNSATPQELPFILQALPRVGASGMLALPAVLNGQK